MRLGALILNGFAQAAALVAMSIVTQIMIDGLRSPAQTSDNLINAAIMISASVGLGWLKWRERIDAETMGQDYVAEIRLMVFQHVSQLSVHALGESRKGLILLRFVNDLTSLRQWVTLGLARLAVSGVVLAGAMCALTIMNPVLGGLLFILFSFGITVAILLGREIDSTMREARRRRGNIAANLTEKLQHMVLVQAFAQRTNERRKVKRQSRSLKKAMVARASAIGSFRAAVYVLVGLSLTSSVVLGTVLVRQGLATTGQIMASLGLLSLLTPSLFDFGRIYEYRKSALIATEKIRRLLGVGPIIRPAETPENLRRAEGRVEFKNVTLRPAVKDFSAVAQAGERVVITGPNGSGKSTLLLLVMRLIEPESGSVLLDGVDIANLKTGALRRMVSIASPTMPLLRGTIESNIVYGSKNASEDDIQQAAARCGMDGLNPDSDYWLGARVAEGGSNLSSGQKMRIILARALLGEPRVLLLDEPDTYLDEEGFQILGDILTGYSGTLILTTHNPTLLTSAVTRWHLGDGKSQPGKESTAA